MSEREVDYIIENIENFILVKMEGRFSIVDISDNYNYMFKRRNEHESVVKKMLEKGVKIVELKTYLEEYRK